MTSVSYSYTEWIASYPNVRTQTVYVSGVKAYLRRLYGDSTTPIEDLADRYIHEITAGGRDHFKDLVSFLGAVHDKPPKSVATYVAAVKNFLLCCAGIELTKMELFRLKDRLPRGTMARTVEKDLSKEDIRKVLLYCDVRGKALLLFLLSSGVRIGEALKLKLADVDLSHEPPMVTVRGEYTKEGDPYITFISSEAKEALVQYLKHRESYIALSVLRTCNARKRKWHPWAAKGSGADRAYRVFPFSTSVAGYLLTSPLSKAGLLTHDPSTGRKQIHVHMLRKFFMSQMKLNVPDNVVEALTGHHAYLSEAYRRYTTKQLGELYLKGEHNILVNSTVDIGEYADELKAKDQKIEGLKGQLLDLTIMNQKLMMGRQVTDTKLSELESKVQRWEAFANESIDARLRAQVYGTIVGASTAALHG
jgi:integrase